MHVEYIPKNLRHTKAFWTVHKLQTFANVIWRWVCCKLYWDYMITIMKIGGLLWPLFVRVSKELSHSKWLCLIYLASNLQDLNCQISHLSPFAPWGVFPLSVPSGSFDISHPCLGKWGSWGAVSLFFPSPYPYGDTLEMPRHPPIIR